MGITVHSLVGNHTAYFKDTNDVNTLDGIVGEYNNMRGQFEETVSVANVYNRFVMFNGNTHHGVQTFGSTPRLTLNFFWHGTNR